MCEEAEDLDGPAQWSLEQSREYDSSYDRLRYAEPAIRNFLTEVHRARTRRDGKTVLLHLEEVADTAGWLAESYFADTVLLTERRYQVLSCRMTGLLHESMLYSGATYEELVDLADKPVADAVAALTPCNQLPHMPRLEQLCNRIALTGPVAQLTKLADLAADGEFCVSLLDSHASGAYEYVRAFVTEATLSLGNLFEFVGKHKAVGLALHSFRELVGELSARLAGRDPGSVRRRRKPNTCPI